MAHNHSPKPTDRTYDTRTIERTVRKGIITRKDLDKHLKALPDVADKGQAVRVELIKADDDHLDDDSED